MFKIEETSYGFEADMSMYSAFPTDADFIWNIPQVESRVKESIERSIQILVDKAEAKEYNYEDEHEKVSLSWKPSIEDFEVYYEDSWQYGANLSIACYLHNDDEHTIWQFQKKAEKELYNIVQQLCPDYIDEAMMDGDVLSNCYYPDYDDEDSVKRETEKARAAGFVYNPKGNGGYGEWVELEEETA